MKNYYARVSDKVLLRRLESKGAVLIEGPKWCGKTTSAKHFAKSFIAMDHPEMTLHYQQMAKINTAYILNGDVPHLIDEWQISPNIWNAVRSEVDNRGEFGQFILTGSSVPPKLDDSIHSGTGRIARMKMRPMSLFESKDSSGQVSLAEIFNNDDLYATDHHSLDEIAFLICRGGWPTALNCNTSIALLQAYDFYDDLIHHDISRVDGIKRDYEKTQRLLKSYAKNIATQATLETIRLDVIKNEIKTFEKKHFILILMLLRKSS